METDDTPAEGPTVLDPAAAEPSLEAVEPVVAPPPVVAVVVTKNPQECFEATLAALGAQDYPDLTVLVIDAGSDDDPTARVAAVSPRAFVRRTGAIGFAAAANVAIEAVEGATFLLCCHDDVELDPSCVRLLVEEAFRSNAAILGPKLVRADNPEILTTVGLAIDRFGVPFSGIEPGELDQEQHDGVRDVFYVPSATMLVRADLFRELGGFDAEAFPGAEDLDLCWRTRLIGGRVLVVPDARAAHREATGDRPRSERSSTAEVDRNRVRTVLKLYSFPTLLWTIPLGLLIAVLESIGLAVSGRGGRARSILGAWTNNLAHPARFRAARRPVQRSRTVPDRELRYLQIRGSTRVAAFFARRLHTDDRLRSLSVAGRDFMGSTARRARRPIAVGGFVLAFAYLVGSRSFITGRVPEVGAFLQWPGAGRLGATFASAWRYSGLGHALPAAPAFALLSVLNVVTLGRSSLAQTIFVLAAVPIGALGVYRCARPLSPSVVPASAAAFAYAVNPVARNMLAAGRLGPLVFFALLPYLTRVLWHA
ncbi:MAG TPA: glycosyltransferase, partial [Acidimicrobiia bacterium]|nr:glycosyltransferase [Acidimicrobiia bacterium]